MVAVDTSEAFSLTRSFRKKQINQQPAEVGLMIDWYIGWLVGCILYFVVSDLV